MWFTPRPGDDDYRPSFQDYWRMTAYPRLVYNSALNQATVTVITNHMDPTVKYTYTFNGVPQTSNVRVFTSSEHGPVNLTVSASDG